MANHNNLALVTAHLADFNMNLGHQRARRIEHLQAPLVGLPRTALDTPCALKMSVEPAGTSARSSMKIAPFRAGRRRRTLLVHDFMPHVDRLRRTSRAPLDDGDRALDAGAETAGIGEDDFHECP